MKRSFLATLFLMGLSGSPLVTSGCGVGGPKVESTSKPAVISGKENLKKRLEAIAQTGSGGSGLMGMREAIMDLKKTESAVADQLLADLTKIEQTNDAAKIKTLAGDMIKKLQ